MLLGTMEDSRRHTPAAFAGSLLAHAVFALVLFQVMTQQIVPRVETHAIAVFTPRADNRRRAAIRVPRRQFDVPASPLPNHIVLVPMGPPPELEAVRVAIPSVQSTPPFPPPLVPPP